MVGNKVCCVCIDYFWTKSNRYKNTPKSQYISHHNTVEYRSGKTLLLFLLLSTRSPWTYTCSTTSFCLSLCDILAAMTALKLVFLREGGGGIVNDTRKKDPICQPIQFSNENGNKFYLEIWPYRCKNNNSKSRVCVLCFKKRRNVSRI